MIHERMLAGWTTLAKGDLAEPGPVPTLVLWGLSRGPGSVDVNNERGSGRIGVFVWLLLISAGLFVAYKTIPTRLAIIEFHDYCDEQTRYAAASRNFSEEELRKNILEKAQELHLSIDPKHVKYKKRKNEIIVNIKHDVTIDLYVKQWPWEYDETFKHIRF
jgi:hypothetical protein